MSGLEKSLIGVILTVCVSGCSVFIQKSVRSDGVYCSTTPAWMITDGALAGGAAVGALTYSDEPLALLPAGVMAASSIVGYVKRRNCINHRKGAPPEAWARDKKRIQKRKERQAEQERLAKQEESSRIAALTRATIRQHKQQEKANAERQAAYDREWDEREAQRKRAKKPKPATTHTSPSNRVHRPSGSSTKVKSTSTTRTVAPPTTPVSKPPAYQVIPHGQCMKWGQKQVKVTSKATAELQQKYIQRCVRCYEQKKTFKVQNRTGLQKCE